MNGGNREGSYIPQQPQQSGESSEHSSVLIKWLVAVVVLAVLVGAAVWLQQYLVEDGGNRVEIGEGQFLTSADEGKVIGSFPKEFLIDETEEVGITESYQIEYTLDGVLFSVVKYTSSISVLDNVIAFTRVLEDGGWSVVTSSEEETLESGASTKFEAQRGEEYVDISMTARDEGIDIVIAYRQPS